MLEPRNEQDQEQEVPDTRGVPSSAKPSDKILELATKMVQVLDVVPFLEKYSPDLYQKLREADEYAESAPGNSDMMFMTSSLPISNGVLHIASNRIAVSQAIEELKKEWRGPQPHTDAISILSALTLIFLVVKGWADHQNSTRERREQWIRILKRIKRWTEDMAVD
jgi:hypothetical protein